MRYALIAILLGAALALADDSVEVDEDAVVEEQVEEVPQATPAVLEAR